MKKTQLIREQWAMIAMEEAEIARANNSFSDSDDDTAWHDFAQSDGACMFGKETELGESSKGSKGKGTAVYDSGEEADREADKQLLEGESSHSSTRVRTARAVLDGVHADEEEPPAMFGMDAPPVFDNIGEDGLDHALEDIAYEGDGIFVGRIFRSKVDCKVKMAIHAINRKFHFRTARSTPEYMEFLCVNFYCPWRVYASLLDVSGNFQIKKANFKHTCPIEDRRQYHRQATTQVIGELLRTRFVPGKGGPGPAQIQRIMHDEFEVHITYWKAWRCREIAMESSFGCVSGSFAMLPSYAKNLETSNPGTVCKTEYTVDKKGAKRFKYLFLSFAASIAGMNYLRPVLLIDGTHLAGRYGGCLITCSAQDGNFQIFPIAYAVVDSENDAAYEWFFQCLQTIIPDNRHLVFVSDRHSSIYSGLSKVRAHI